MLVLVAEAGAFRERLLLDMLLKSYGLPAKSCTSGVLVACCNALNAPCHRSYPDCPQIYPRSTPELPRLPIDELAEASQTEGLLLKDCSCAAFDRGWFCL